MRGKIVYFELETTFESKVLMLDGYESKVHHNSSCINPALLELSKIWPRDYSKNAPSTSSRLFAALLFHLKFSTSSLSIVVKKCRLKGIIKSYSLLTLRDPI